MNIMKALNSIKIVMLVFMLVACQKQEVAIETPSINSEDNNVNEIIKKELSFDKAFTISFWVKPLSNYYGSTILELNDGIQSVSLINNSEDENYLSMGLSLIHENGSLYGGSNYFLDTYNYNYVNIGYIDNTFFLYLNGELIDDKAFGDNFNIDDLTLTIGSDSFVGEFKDITFSDKCYGEEETKASFKQNLSLRLSNIDYSEEFKNDAKGKVSLPHSNIDILYECGPYMKIENGYLIFDKNESDEDIKTELKATYKNDEHSVDKILSFIIRGNNDESIIDETLKVIDNQLSYVISESNFFDDNINDCKIDYEIIEGSAKYQNNHFLKSGNNEKENIRVKVTIKREDLQREIIKDVILIDEYYGYLLVYFDGNDGWPEHLTGDETIYLAASQDLYNWQKINTKPIVKSNSGSGRFRDPYVARDENGDFIITTTEGYDNPGMYLIKTNDFITFDTSYLRFNSVDNSLKLEGHKVWAPEFVYDQSRDMYSIIFSNPSEDNESIFAVDTKDFKSFSYPYIYFDAGYNVIDGNVTMIDNQYYLLYKDENKNTIHYAVSSGITNPTWRIYDDSTINEGYNAEGPFMLADHINNEYRFYIDSYKESKIYSTNIYKWKDTIDIYPDVDEGITNIGGVRHFSIIELTKNEYERIVKYYD